MLSRAPVASAVDALALHTAGYPALPEMTVHEGSGQRHVMWYVHTNPADPTKTPTAARQLLAQFSHKEEAKNLQFTQPEHPFIAARHAIETVGALQAWLAGKAGPVAILKTPGRLLRAAPAMAAQYDLQQHIWGQLQPAFVIQCPFFAAALIVCGFPCAPQLMPPREGRPGGWAFPARSLTLPALGVEDCMGRFFPPGGGALLGPALPGGWLEGEHPFEYAYTAALNTRGLEPLLTAAGKNPQIFMKKPGHGTGGVLATMSLLERDTPFRRRAHEFLT